MILPLLALLAAGLFFSGHLYVGIIFLLATLLSFAVILSRNKRKADAAQLIIVKLEQEKAELEALLEMAKLGGKNKDYRILAGKTRQRQMRSYLERLEKVRTISRALMTPVYKYTAFCDILDDYVGRQKKFFRGNIELNIRQREAWDSLPASLMLDIYRIVQEGLSNAVKHACAGDITLQFDSNAGAFRFFIEDDGEGLDTTTSARGIGLKGLRERMENLPGKIFLTSDTVKGTRVSVIFHPADHLSRPGNIN